MRPWNLERKLTLAVLALFLVPTVVAGVILAALYRRGVFEDPAALGLAVSPDVLLMADQVVE